jgi:hypothetical protein
MSVYKFMIVTFWILSLLALAGCEGLPASVGDVYAQAEQAQAAVRAEKQRAEATQQAMAAEGDLLGLQLAATRQAQELSLELATATAAAASSRATAVQAGAWAEATQRSVELQETLQADQMRATQTALALAVQADVRRAEQNAMWDDFWSVLRPALALFVILALILMAFWMAVQTYQWWLTWQDRRNSHFETRSGTVVWIANGEGEMVPQLLATLRPVGVRASRRAEWQAARPSDVEVIPLTRSGSVLSSPMKNQSQPGGITVLVLEMLRDAVRVSGEDEQQVPSWRKLPGWSSERWQRVVAALEASQAVEVAPGRGTYVSNRYRDLGDVLYAVETRQLRIRPAPVREVVDG